MRKYLIILCIGCFCTFSAKAQKYLYLFQHDGQIQKITLAKVDSITFPVKNGEQYANIFRRDGNTHRLPLAMTDSLVFTDTKLFKGNYLVEKYTVTSMNIEVENGEKITSKEKSDYKNCKVTIDGKGDYADYMGTARIRGRGNSSWLYYPKKPYRIKLDNKAEILGLGSDKDWVLLSNYRDPTMLMNAFGFELADRMGLRYCNHSRYIEVTLNGEYIGLYQLTEQVEQGGDRVDIDDEKGVLLYVDLDDAPGLSPEAADNFFSTVYQVPVCVKYPDEPTAGQVSAIQDDFAQMERYIKACNYDSLATRLDIASFIDYLMIEELVHNVEMQAPRSIYMYKDSDNIYHMGPVWDFDGAFSYSWQAQPGEHWLSSHGYFTSQGTIYGDQPATSNNVNRFFLNMFKNARFVKEYKERWNEVKDVVMTDVWPVMDSIMENSTEAYARDVACWRITPDYTTQVEALKEYITARIAKLTNVVAKYTEPADDSVLKPQDEKYNDVIQTFTVSFPYDNSGYSGITVAADMQSLCNAFQMNSDAIPAEIGNSILFYGMNNDSTLIDNYTANGYGHWFNASGDVSSYNEGTLYSEFNENGMTFNIGQYPGKMKQNDTYTIRQALVLATERGDSYRALFLFHVTLGDEKYTCQVTESGGSESGEEEKKDTVIVRNYSLTFSAGAGYGGPQLEVDAEDFYSTFGYTSVDAFADALNSREVSLSAIDGSTGEENFNSTAKNGGFWFDASGDVCGWGSSARVYMEPHSTTFSNPLTFDTGVYPGQVAAGETYAITIALKKEKTVIKICLTITLTE